MATHLCSLPRFPLHLLERFGHAAQGTASRAIEGTLADVEAGHDVPVQFAQDIGIVQDEEGVPLEDLGHNHVKECERANGQAEVQQVAPDGDPLYQGVVPGDSVAQQDSSKAYSGVTGEAG
jgi:hypothetical protein